MSLVNEDENKVRLYIKYGKLKTAYLLAVKLARRDLMKEILTACQVVKLTPIESLCHRWLASHP